MGQGIGSDESSALPARSLMIFSARPVLHEADPNTCTISKGAEGGGSVSRSGGTQIEKRAQAVCPTPEAGTGRVYW